MRHEASLCGKDSGKRSICAEIPVARDHLCAGMTEQEETTVCWNDRETRGFVLRVEITLCGENSRTCTVYHCICSSHAQARCLSGDYDYFWERVGGSPATDILNESRNLVTLPL